MAISTYVKGRCFDRLWQRTKWSPYAVSATLLREFNPAVFMNGGTHNLILATDGALSDMIERGRIAWRKQEENKEADKS